MLFVNRPRSSSSTVAAGRDRVQPPPLLDGMTAAQVREWLEREARTVERQARREVLTGWLLRWRWEWFATGTFKQCDSLDYCRRRARAWWRSLSRAVYGRRWERRGEGVYGVVAYERQQRGDWHWHALVAGLRGESYATGHALYRRDGLLWLAPVRDGGVQYVTKYATKGDRWDVFGRWPLDLAPEPHELQGAAASPPQGPSGRADQDGPRGNGDRDRGAVVTLPAAGRRLSARGLGPTG